MIRLQFGAFKLCDIFAVKDNLSTCRLIHTDQCSAQSGFSTAGRTDKCGNFFFVNGQIHVLERVEIAVIQIQIRYIKLFSHVFLISALCAILSLPQTASRSGMRLHLSEGQ